MKNIVSSLMIFSILAVLSSCAPSTAEQLQQLQQTQNSLNSQASSNLAKIDDLHTKIAKYRLEADQLQKQSNSLANDIASINKAYSNFKDPNSDSAIAVSKELVQRTLQKVKIDEKINRYRTLANDYQAQINDLKAISQTQANQTAKISQQISELKSQVK
ncbi:hypothetical protein [Francisella hispaniensis]|uniref:Lipoprotein n=1 Tax=Francisella hispaniensis FSC454 TaxID=1088883 RepID=A0AAC9J4Y2_9GAMM|nr:hypothetical protein [Francisella hispaniensis]APD50000.1 hypothetical protein FSC454_01980 [Francisella hispaniensis FSC454]KYW86210.1 hypothetical protein AUF42_03255 [Francisella hispaniensis FSC454]